MRSRLMLGVVTIVLALLAAVGPFESRPASSLTGRPLGTAGPDTATRAGPDVGTRFQVDAGFQNSEVVGSTAAPAASRALSLDETRAKVEQTESALVAARELKQTDDLRVAKAAAGVEELETEAQNVARATVASAIRAFQRGEAVDGLLDVEDLNAGFRARTLNEAAIVANTDVFNRFHAKQRDADLALAELDAYTAINERLSAQVAALQAELEADQAWLAQLEERSLHQRARAVTAQASVWTQNRGRKQGFFLLTCPVNGVHSFIDSWGFPRSGGRRHKGVDILANIGVEIVAPVNGRVEHFSNSVGGRSFRMWDDNGNYFYGTHLSRFGKDGRVNAGEVIGYVGDDGNAAGIPHLHFEIHAGGRGNQINPFIDSAAVCSGAQ